MKKFILYFIVFNTIVYNIPVFKYSLNNLELFSSHAILSLISVVVAMVFINVLLFFSLAIILPKFLMKAFFILVVLCNSLAIFFVNTYNVILDKSMMGNLLNTNTSEAFSYFDINIFIYFIVFGLIPAYIIYKINIEQSKRLVSFAYAIVISVVSILILYLNATTWLWLDKHAKYLGGLVMPWSYVGNVILYKKSELKKNEKRENLPNAKFLNEDEKLVVLIIGESARTANFSLYGYEKNTNPKLAHQKIDVLKNTKSAATYTTASVHSMLSYKGTTSDSYEVLPNYLNRHGVDVLWRAKNWGHPKLNIKYYEKGEVLKDACKTQECEYDGLILTNLKERISKLKSKKKLVVLHTSGSHGPTYFKKYPKSFEIFKPVCKSVDVASCTKEELFNAYDNSVVYTDHFINSTIEILKQIDIPSMMIYISDHGESLGEFGLYLHGTPYSIAPDFQKDIPFIIWKSDSFKKSIKPFEKYGHYNIFHTIMNALDMRSKIYNEELNLLKD